MKRNHAAWALLPLWIAATAACQSELVDGTTGAGGGNGGGGTGGEQPSTTTSQTASSGSTSSGGAGCVLDESKLDGCVLQ
jgi:hypothetical protein